MHCYFNGSFCSLVVRGTSHFYSFFRKWFWQELIFGMTTMAFGLGKPSPGQYCVALIIVKITFKHVMFLLHSYYRLHRKITLGSFNTGPFFSTLMAQSCDCAKNPYNMGFWHCLSILAPLQSVAIEIECSACALCKIKNGRRKKNTRSTVKPTFGASTAR